MSARPRSATPAGASSRASGCGSDIAPEAAAIRTIHVSEPVASVSRDCSAARAGRRGVRLRRGQSRASERRCGRGFARPGRSPCARRRGRGSRGQPTTGVRFTVVHGRVRACRCGARLVVAADGAHSQFARPRASPPMSRTTTRWRWSPTSAPIVPHEGNAYERFTACRARSRCCRGTMVGYAVIWACRPERAQTLLALDESAYLAQLQSQFGWRAGRFLRAGPRAPIR